MFTKGKALKMLKGVQLEEKQPMEAEGSKQPDSSTHTRTRLCNILLTNWGMFCFVFLF